MILFVFIFRQFFRSSKSTAGVLVGCKSTNFSGNKKDAQEQRQSLNFHIRKEFVFYNLHFLL